jgi:hypothetical protein
VVAYTKHALYAATHRIFWALAIAAVLGLVTQLLMPGRTEPLEFTEDAQ